MGNLLFVSWYQQGLAVFDIADPTHPILVGNYDTWPGPSYEVFGGGDGDWGVYPFVGLDRVLVSDRATGLYILDVRKRAGHPPRRTSTSRPPQAREPQAAGANVEHSIMERLINDWRRTMVPGAGVEPARA